MKAEIISIGTELLLGEITDTNAAYLASQLPLLGLDLNFISTVGDNQKRLIDTLEQACQRSDIVIATGGLGPTQDDITREALAELLGEELKVDPAIAQEIQSIFSKHGLDMPPNNLKQAMVIPSSQVIPGRGTAPGWWVKYNGRIIITMPGPPREMQSMWTEHVFPRLQQEMGAVVIVSRTLKTFGLGESKVDELLPHLLTASNPSLGIYAKSDGIHLRITAKAGDTDEAQQMITRREADIRTILGDYVWGMDSDSLERVIGALLAAKGLTLATMESYTGGLLANIITNVSKSSTYFKGGLVGHFDEAQVTLGIDSQLISRYGTISAEVAKSMATVARNKLGAAIGLGLTAVTGPSEIEGKSIGTIFVGIDDGQSQQSFLKNYPGNRLQVKQRAVTSALFELRRILL